MPFATVIRSGSIPNTSLPNQRAEAAEAGDHLVGDQQHVVAGAAPAWIAAK